VQRARKATKLGVIHYGSTAAAMDEAAVMLTDEGVDVDVMRVRGFPFCDEVVDFVAAHDRVFVVEQNRDAQLRSLMLIEHGLDPHKLTPVLHYDGSPITARFIARAIGDLVQPKAKVREKALS
jgi:2-oxoglutarate ferredoxin oxidoreductase subunit alpha